MEEKYKWIWNNYLNKTGDFYKYKLCWLDALTILVILANQI